MVLAAIAMSQVEVDMLPPTQRAIFMELVRLNPSYSCINLTHVSTQRSVAGI